MSDSVPARRWICKGGRASERQAGKERPQEAEKQQGEDQVGLRENDWIDWQTFPNRVISTSECIEAIRFVQH